MNSSRFAGLLLLLLVTVGGAQPALADEPQKRRVAEVLYERGQRQLDKAERLLDEGHQPERARRLLNKACRTYREAWRQWRGIGIGINFARCRRRQGRMAEARALFAATLELHREAAARGDTKQGRGDYLRKQIAGIEALLPKLMIIVDMHRKVQGLRVFDGPRELPPHRWNRPIDVDPGEHHIRAQAPGHAPFEVTVAIPSAQRKEVPIPMLEPLAPQPDPGNGDGGGHTAMPAGRIGALVVGSIGGAALIASAVFGGVALDQWGEAQRRCPQSPCADLKGASLDDAARRNRDIAITTAVGGGLATLGAALLWVLAAPPDEQEQPTAAVVPWIAPSGAGLVVGGAF